MIEDKNHKKLADTDGELFGASPKDGRRVSVVLV